MNYTKKTMTLVRVILPLKCSGSNIFSKIAGNINFMKDLNDNSLYLFAKISGIIAKTFQQMQQIVSDYLKQRNPSSADSKNGSEENGNSLPTSKSSKKTKINGNNKRIIDTSNGINGKNNFIHVSNQVSSIKRYWLEKREEYKYKNSVSDEEDPLNESTISKKSKAKLYKRYFDESETKERKKKKLPKWEQYGKPRPPVNSFMLFLKDTKSSILEAKPELTPSEVSTYASSLWSEMTAYYKYRYQQQYKINKAEYDVCLKEYRYKEKTKIAANSQGTTANGVNGNTNDINAKNSSEKGGEKESNNTKKGNGKVMDILEMNLEDIYRASNSEESSEI